MKELTTHIEQSLLKVINNSHILFWLVSIDWKKVLYASPAFEQIYGYPVSQVYENADLWYRSIHPNDLDWVLAYYEKNHGQQTELEYRIIRSDGQTIWIRDITCPIHNEQGELVMLAGLAEDITGRKQVEDELKRSEERYRSFVMNLHGIAFRGRMDYIPIFFHGAVKEITGYTEKDFLEGNPRWDQVICPEDRSKLCTEDEQRLHTVPYYSFEREYRIRRKDGSLCWVHENIQNVCDDSGKPAMVQGMIFDINERKRTDEALQRSEERIFRLKKMESLGILAGGVAHDLNNVLSGIVSYPELILLELPEDSKFRKPIETIKESGDRAVAIVQDLLTIARGVATGKSPLNLNDIVNDCLNSPELKRLQQINPEISFNIRLDEKLFNIKGSGVHLKKAVMNLIYNASEALQDKGVITVTTENTYLDKALKGYDEINTGDYCILTVSDDGTGIAPVDLERIFEPFYSKKVMGISGTGLGLTVVWNTVRDHRGYIDIVNSENGVTFHLYFPITREEISEVKSSINIKAYMGNGEKILVIDDEKIQREISCKILDALGYEAISVPSGEAALDYLKDNSADLLLLDMIMGPGMNGRMTFEKVIEMNPQQKAILVSGFAETQEVQKAQQLGAGQFIKKPLTIEVIGPAIKQALKKSSTETFQ